MSFTTLFILQREEKPTYEVDEICSIRKQTQNVLLTLLHFASGFYLYVVVYKG